MKIVASCLLLGTVWLIAPTVSANDLVSAAIESSEPTLYEDLGGEEALRKVIDHMFALALENPKMAPIFEHSNIDRLKGLIFIHTCHIADGPCSYEGQDMRRAHDGLGIRTWHFNKLVENMQSGMDAQNIPFRVQNRLMARLAPFYDDVTGRSPVPPRSSVKPKSYSHTPGEIERTQPIKNSPLK